MAGQTLAAHPGGGCGGGHCGREAERPSAGDVGTERSWTHHSGKQGRLSPEARPPQDQLLAQSPDPLNTETFFTISRLQESRVSSAGMGRHPATPTRLPHRPEESAVLWFTEPARPSRATLPGHCGVGWLPCSCFVPDDRLRGADPEAGSRPPVSCQGLQASCPAASGGPGGGIRSPLPGSATVSSSKASAGQLTSAELWLPPPPTRGLGRATPTSQRRQDVPEPLFPSPFSFSLPPSSNHARLIFLISPTNFPSWQFPKQNALLLRGPRSELPVVFPCGPHSSGGG